MSGRPPAPSSNVNLIGIEIILIFLMVVLWLGVIEPNLSWIKANLIELIIFILFGIIILMVLISVYNGVIEFFKKIFKRKLKQISKKLIPQKEYGYLRFVYKKGYGLSRWVEEKSVRKYNKLLHQFIERNKRKPNKSEVGRIIINASHKTIKYRKGRSGHWGRQKVRHYLFNLHGIKYKKK